MAVSVRTWLVVAALACAVTLLLRSADAQAAATATASTRAPASAKKPKCAPGAAMPCRVGGVHHDPENQEEEGLFNVRVKAPNGAGDTDSDDDYSDPDQPKDEQDDDELVVLGH